MRPSPSNRQPRSGAFTLVELLVSTAVLSLLLIMLAQVANLVTNTWTAGQGRAERRQNGRALVDFIGRELRAAALPVDMNASASTANLQFVMNPSTVGAEWRNPQALFWQAPLATDTTYGDMAEIGYFVRWDSTGGIPRATLCRMFLNPGDSNHRIYSPSYVANWVTGDLLDSAAPANQASAYRGLFAENVIGFWARCLDASGAAVTNTADGGFDSRQSYTGKNSAGTAGVIPAPALPTSVEVSLVLLDARAAARLTTMMQATIVATTKTSVNAEDCLEKLQANPACKPILQGASAHLVRVYLENGP